MLRAQWMVTKNLGILDRIDELGENLAGNIRAGLDPEADRYRSRRSHSQPALEAIRLRCLRPMMSSQPDFADTTIPGDTELP